MRFWLLAILAACYSPRAHEHCDIGCNADGVCPDGLMCGTNLRCFDPAIGDVCPSDGGPPSNCFGVNEPPFAEICVDPKDVPENVELPLTIMTAVGSQTCTNPVGVYDDYCIVWARDLRVTGSVKTRGPRPLVLLGTNTLRVEPAGEVGAASYSNDVSGALPPAANLNCGIGNDGAASPSLSSTGGGGAGAAVFGHAAGGGGSGGGLGGVVKAQADATRLRGGCMGGDGGQAPNSHGDGGGAVYLLGNSMLRIDGTVNASGGGGRRAGVTGGGGGGGSGGMILLWSRTPIELATNARVMAMGGGGSSGGGAMANPIGVPGGDPIVPGMPASGGMAGNADGGKGASQTAPGLTGLGNSTNGGGGGGGSVGLIKSIPTPGHTEGMDPAPP